MKDLFVILGEANTKKSSLIRALTGISNENTFQIATCNKGNMETFIIVSSIQERLEGDVQKNKIMSNQSEYWYSNFPHKLKVKNAKNMFISLRVGGRNNVPLGTEYIDELLNNGWNLKGIALMNEATNGRVHQHYCNKYSSQLVTAINDTHKNSKNDPKTANEIASILRNNWDWK
jgi:hypothetical protein